MTDDNRIDIELLNDLIVGRVEPQIYAFTTETIPNYLKVGDTYRPLETRLNEWRKHFPNLKKRFQEVAKVDEETFFRDYAVHKYLENEIQKARLMPDSLEAIPYYSNEFFKDTTTDDLDNAIIDIKDCHENNDSKYPFYKFDASHIPIIHTYNRTENYNPRPNQQETIDRFNEALKKGRSNLLMYAVMRFGKSFTSMCCAVEMGAKIVLVVSAKADVKEEWKKTVESHIKFDGFTFLDSNSLLQSDTIIKEKIEANEKLALFLTLQDLQGDTIKSKHKEVFENQIDLLLIDETHFGARALEYGKILKDFKSKEIKSELKLNDNSIDDLDNTTKSINAKVRLHLSGTPYRILMNSEFTNEDIIAFYQFTNIAEDQEQWNEEHLTKDDIKEWDNPYYGFPQMIRFAFNPNESSRIRMEELRKNGITYAFSELLKPKSILKDNSGKLHKKFIYEQEIIDLLKVIDGTEEDDNLLSFLDYAKLKDGKMCRHIVCVLPYRASCDAFEELIKSNKFKNLNSYEVINISGVDNDKVYNNIQSVKTKITTCESENKKTITLTVNRMLTGSTVPQWDTMLYLKDTTSPQEYDQAIFRLQSQFIKVYKEPNGDVVKYNMKPQTLLVDFNPNRMFQMQEQKAQIYNVNTESNGNNKLEDRITRELQISPIVVLNNKKMVQVEPSDILDAVRKYSSERSVLDEATTISIDYSLLDIEAIKAVIDKQGKIGSKQGIKIKASEGEGDEIDVPDNGEESDEGDKETRISKENEIDYKGKFAMYYARILFFSFLTDSIIKSLQEIIDEINSNSNNLRIATNLNLEASILLLFQKNINPFILSELDYKIQNINSLANDTAISPIERASNAMQRFSRLSDSEIVTPETVTEKIINTIPNGSIGNTTLMLDIASKQGEFVYAIYKKFGKEVANNFYSIPTSNIAYEFTRKVYKLLELNIENIEENYTSYDLIEQNNLTVDETIMINKNTMKFDVIVGNPPYQESAKSGNRSKPIYNKFVELSKELNPNFISLIIPSRWMSGGLGLSNFRDSMLSDKRMSKLTDYPVSNEMFPGVEVKGGICYFLWNNTHKNKCAITSVRGEDSYGPTKRSLDEFDILVRDSRAVEILNKILTFDETSITTILSVDKEFGWTSNFNNFNKRKVEGHIPLHYIRKAKRNIGYINRENINKSTELIDTYKVLIPKAGSDGGKKIPDSVLGKPLIADNPSVCTQSFLFFHIDSKFKAQSIEYYLKTKFFRFLVSLRKITQDATKSTYKWVPIQNFTSESDIDWNKPIENIDQQLYKKYKLKKEETEFIEKMIKPM